MDGSDTVTVPEIIAESSRVRLPERFDDRARDHLQLVEQGYRQGVTQRL